MRTLRNRKTARGGQRYPGAVNGGIGHWADQLVTFAVDTMLSLPFWYIVAGTAENPG